MGFNSGTAASTAGVGALAGTMAMPGIGTAVGAGTGYLLGGIMGGQNADEFGNPSYDWTEVQKQRAAQEQARQNQQALYDMLKAQAEGKGPSVAQNQLAQSQQQNIAAAQSQAAGARGGALANMLAQRQASDQQSQAMQQTAGQAATLRAQEQLGAMGQMGQVAGQQREGDIGMYKGETDSLLEQNKIQNSANEINAGIRKNNSDQNSSMIGGMVNGAMGAVSDVRMKSDVHPANDAALRELLGSIQPTDFRYTGSAEPHTGVVAQDLERSQLGRRLVGEDPNTGTKYIDGSKALQAALASLGHMDRRVGALENPEQEEPDRA